MIGIEENVVSYIQEKFDTAFAEFCNRKIDSIDFTEKFHKICELCEIAENILGKPVSIDCNHKVVLGEV